MGEPLASPVFAQFACAAASYEAPLCGNYPNVTAVSDDVAAGAAHDA